MSDLASMLQNWWRQGGENMRRQAGQSNLENMREHLPTALMGLSAIAPSTRSVAAGVFRPRANATFDQTNLSPTLQTIYRNGTPEQQAEAMRIWGQLNGQKASSPAPAPAAPTPQPLQQARQELHAMQPAPSSPARAQAMHEFYEMQPPPRSQMHGLAGPAAGGGLAAYLQSQPEGPY